MSILTVEGLDAFADQIREMMRTIYDLGSLFTLSPRERAELRYLEQEPVLRFAGLVAVDPEVPRGIRAQIRRWRRASARKAASRKGRKAWRRLRRAVVALPAELKARLDRVVLEDQPKRLAELVAKRDAKWGALAPAGEKP